MERYDLGFVVGGGMVLASHQARPADEQPAQGDPPTLNPRFMRRTPLSQLLIAGSGLPAAGLPHLERLLPVFASQAVAGGLGFPLPVVWAYELVPGAVLTGRAEPGAQVVGEIGLRERGRDHRYRAWTVADGEGRWRMRVAVPSGWTAGTVGTGGAWHVVGAIPGDRDVEVPEEAVRTGREIAVP
jgi:hypothetical protein